MFYPAWAVSSREWMARLDQLRAMDGYASSDLALNQIQLFLTGTDPLVYLARISVSRGDMVIVKRRSGFGTLSSGCGPDSTIGSGTTSRGSDLLRLCFI